MKKILSLCIGTILLFPLSAFGGNSDSLRGKVSQWMSANNGIRFLENKGQMYDEQHKPVPNVLYEASGGGMNVYVTTSGLSYVFTKYNKFKKKSTAPIADKRHQPDSVTINYCRADMQLVGASIKKENIVQEGESYDRNDYYYGGICPDGILGVHSYTKITIKNIYPGIDWVLYGSKHGLKYDFVVHPGADPSQIKLHYKWTDAPQLQPDGSIKITTPMGAITEGTPESFSNSVQVTTSYTIKDTNISFKIENYNSTQTLIIDPTLVWATYYAGMELMDFNSLYDDGMNVWLTGGAFSAVFPTVNPGHGAYFQGVIAGTMNAFIFKFNVAGAIEWATYYGGSAEDEGISIYSNDGNVWVTGSAISSDFPTFNPGGGAYFQGTRAGSTNVFVIQFDTSGVRKWATYYGGNETDIGYSINIDGNSIWVTGYTESSNFPTLNPGGGVYFQGVLAGSQNAFILQFTITGVLKWATYYGGSDADIGYSIQSDRKNVWITGSTESNDFPTMNPGGGSYFQGILGGIQNAFILQFTTTGIRKWATYYGGNTVTYGDIGYSVHSDGINVWVTGSTSSTDFPVLNPGGGAYFQGALASAENVFILKFNSTGVCKWATYYGGFGGDIGYSINSDGHSVWVCGATASYNFPILNPGCGFYDDTLGRTDPLYPSQDVFVLQFDTGGVQTWGTYYGTDNENDNSAISSDGKNLFVAGDAGYEGYPTVNPGGNAYFCDTIFKSAITEVPFIAKFVYSGLMIDSTVSICKGDTTILHVSGAATYKWSPPKGLSATNIANPVASPTITTTYTVIGTGGCAGVAIDSITVVVNTVAGLKITKDTSICTGNSITLNASGGINYSWSNGATTSSITITDDSVSKTYTIAISDGQCTQDTGVTIIVVPIPKIILSGNKIICKGDSVQLNVSGSTNFLWSNGNTTNSYTTGGIYADSTVTVTAYNSIGCSHDTTITVYVAPRPKPIISNVPPKCQGELDTLFVTGGETYLWSNGTTKNMYYTGPINTITNIIVTAYDSDGCSHDTSITITPDIPVLAACCDATIEAGNDTTLVASGNSKLPYQWSPQVTCLNPNCDSVNVSPTVTTTYTVTATDSLGCTIERTVTIMVEKTCFNFTVPNVFTPDYLGATGINNVFYIKTENLDSWSIIIYDRWGKEMYKSSNPNQYWDGTTESGSKTPAGVYYYIINANCQGTSYKRDGFVQLIR